MRILGGLVLDPCVSDPSGRPAVPYLTILNRDNLNQINWSYPVNSPAVFCQLYWLTHRVN